MGHINSYPWAGEDPIDGKRPARWFGTDAVDGDAEPWLGARLGSMYIYINGTTTATLYLRTALNDADADWEDVQADE